MIIACPQCRTKYRVSDEKVKPEGSGVRCTRCGHVFTAYPEDDISAETSAERGPYGEGPGPGNNGGESMLPGRGSGPSRPGKRRTAVLLLVILALLAALAVYVFWPSLQTLGPSGGAQKQDGMALNHKAEESADAEDIALRDVRQYMVENEHMGRILVVEGRAENTSDQARQKVQISASLFDRDGHKIQEKVFLGGNTASVYELQTLSREELEAALSAPAGVLANNSHLPPQQKVDFMTFFADYPDHVAEFSLKVIQARAAEKPSPQAE